MQLINKDAVKKTLFHTWYFYPLAIALSTLLWMWGFQAFHQPTKHQKLVMFVSANVKSDNFAKKIMNEHYERENLREVDVIGNLPSTVGYASKLNIYLNDSDYLILDEGTIEQVNARVGDFFVEMTSYVKEYVPATASYYSKDTKDYGVKIKTKNESNYLSTYLTFDESKDYYFFLSKTSKNLGKTLDEKNEKHDNALTYMNYLLTECL